MTLGSCLWVFGNLFLAAIPVALGFLIARGMRGQMRAVGRVRWATWLPLLLLWLVFLPNTCYLLTEWRHYLDTVSFNPMFYSVYHAGHYEQRATLELLLLTLFFIVYSGLGLLALFAAVWPLDRLLRERLGHTSRWAQAVVFVLCAMGVYLGLVNRLNSWDVIHVGMVLAVLQTTMQIMTRPLLLSVLLCFGALLWLLYVLFDIWTDGVLARCKAISSGNEAGEHFGGVYRSN